MNYIKSKILKISLKFGLSENIFLNHTSNANDKQKPTTANPLISYVTNLSIYF